MTFFYRFLSYVAPETHWRLTCPNTLEAIAQDFIENHLPNREELNSLNFEQVDNRDPWFAWRRRICTIYGVATSYKHPNGKLARPSWNHRLWSNVPDLDPEVLVDRIFDIVIARLRDSLDS